MAECFPSSTNPPLTGPFGQPLIEFPSMSYHDAFFAYSLPPDMYSRKYYSMYASTYNNTNGIVIPPLDPEIVALESITIVGTSSLWETSLTPVTPTQQPMSITSLPTSLAATCIHQAHYLVILYGLHLS
jgi:hypothetical protein